MELPDPIYNEGAVEGISGFAEMPSDTAILKFVGREGYEGAWRGVTIRGMMWHFSSIAAGLMADNLPAEVKEYIKAAGKTLR